MLAGAVAAVAARLGRGVDSLREQFGHRQAHGAENILDGAAAEVSEQYAAVR